MAPRIAEGSEPGEGKREEPLAQKHHFVGPGEDPEVRGQRGGEAVLAQHAIAEGMEGGDEGLGVAVGHQLVHPLRHLPRRLFGEGEGENFLGPRALGGDEMGDAPGQNRGLPGARARDDQKRTVAMKHGAPLRLVEAIENDVLAGLRSGLDVRHGLETSRTQARGGSPTPRGPRVAGLTPDRRAARRSRPSRPSLPSRDGCSGSRSWRTRNDGRRRRRHSRRAHSHDSANPSWRTPWPWALVPSILLFSDPSTPAMGSESLKAPANGCFAMAERRSTSARAVTRSERDRPDPSYMAGSPRRTPRPRRKSSRARRLDSTEASLKTPRPRRRNRISAWRFWLSLLTTLICSETAGPRTEARGRRESGRGSREVRTSSRMLTP